MLLMTPWFAPIIWDGTYDSAILDAQFRNTTIGLTVFAIKKKVRSGQLGWARVLAQENQGADPWCRGRSSPGVSHFQDEEFGSWGRE